MGRPLTWPKAAGAANPLFVMRWAKWMVAGAVAGLFGALVPVVRGDVGIPASLSKIAPVRIALQKKSAPAEADLGGLDLRRLQLRPERVLTPLSDGRYAELTLDPHLQRASLSQMKKYRVPEAGVVAIDVSSGNVLAYASYVNRGPKFDVNVRAEPPAASVFKVVTGAALVEKAGLNGRTEQCYHGGRSRLSASELREDPARDKWCATLAMAMGRSLNVVFGRLAQKHLTPEDVTAMGGAFGFGSSVPFAVPNEPMKIDIPNDPLEFARASAGFWHTSLSPLGGAVLSQSVANGGLTLKPRIVRAIYKKKRRLWTAAKKPVVLRRALKATSAEEVTKMMLQTVSNGSAYKSFHDRRGRPFLPNIRVAGKTGTLTRHKKNRHYTWFVGFAPAEKPEIALAALVVNTPTWRIKGPDLARDVFRAYFAKTGAKGVTSP